MTDVIYSGLRKAWSTFLELIKIIVPIYILVTFLKYTGIINILADFFKPVMVYIGLPGESILALISAYLINPYAGIAVISSLGLSGREITILACMIGVCHNLILESVIFKKIGVSIPRIIFIRIVASLVVGIVLNILL